LGGDEFVVLLTSAGRPEADMVIQKFGAALHACNTQAKRGYDLAFSCGMVQFEPDKHRAIETLLAEGDAQMYAIKAAKK
ncbi:MAG TPA: diguanylate cyclase, partial [Duganella sp.]